MNAPVREPDDGPSKDGPLNYAPKKKRRPESDADPGAPVTGDSGVGIGGTALEAVEVPRNIRWRWCDCGASQQARADARPASRAAAAPPFNPPEICTGGPARRCRRGDGCRRRRLQIGFFRASLIPAAGASSWPVRSRGGAGTVGAGRGRSFNRDDGRLRAGHIEQRERDASRLSAPVRRARACIAGGRHCDPAAIQ
jgi:hypothetical protein